MLEDGTARLEDEFGNAVRQFWDPENKVWREISEADMGHIHDVVTWWNETGCQYGAKAPEVRDWMLSSENYILEYFSTNRSKGSILGKVFLCLGEVAFAAGVVAGLCCFIPGPGWLVAAAIGVTLLAAAGIAYMKCKSASTTRVWVNHSQKVQINKNRALLLSSQLTCPAQGGTITPKETLWQAWGSAALTNLGV